MQHKRKSNGKYVCGNTEFQFLVVLVYGVYNYDSLYRYIHLSLPLFIYLLQLKPAASRDKKGFEDFEDYLYEKKKGRVGLAKVGSLALFLLPRCELVSSLGYKLDNSKLLAIVG